MHYMVSAISTAEFLEACPRLAVYIDAAIGKIQVFTRVHYRTLDRILVPGMQVTALRAFAAALRGDKEEASRRLKAFEEAKPDIEKLCAKLTEEAREKEMSSGTVARNWSEQILQHLIEEDTCEQCCAFQKFSNDLAEAFDSTALKLEVSSRYMIDNDHRNHADAVVAGALACATASRAAGHVAVGGNFKGIKEIGALESLVSKFEFAVGAM